MGKSKSSKKRSQSKKRTTKTNRCSSKQIKNPLTKRCVNKSGKIGKSIISSKKRKSSRKSNKKEPINIAFPRQNMFIIPSGVQFEGTKAEGYWRDQELNDQSFQKDFPWPKIHETPWTGKQEFLDKLAKMEKLANENIYDYETDRYKKPNSLYCKGYRGHSISRIDQSGLGSHEFVDPKKNIVWTDALRRHYVGKYNVIPSKEFYDYVMNYKL
jgi:hypothetical protein